MQISRKESLAILLKELIIKGLTFDYLIIKRVIKKELILSKKDKVLDIGSGTGVLASLFPKASYLGIDLNPKLIAFAKNNYQYNFQVVDATKLSFPISSFEKILISGILHHLNNSSFKRVCQEVKKVLRKDGQVLAIEAIPPIYQFNLIGKLFRLMDKGHYIRSYEGYKKIFKLYFKIKNSYKIPGGIFDYAVFSLS